jgi:hypothetical protein
MASDDVINKVAEAIYHTNAALYRVSSRPLSEISEIGQKRYRVMAEAVIKAISIDHWQAAPGDRRECPTCEMDWVARSAGPLDIAWTPSP